MQSCELVCTLLVHNLHENRWSVECLMTPGATRGIPADVDASQRGLAGLGDARAHRRAGRYISVTLSLTLPTSRTLQRIAHCKNAPTLSLIAASSAKCNWALPVELYGGTMMEKREAMGVCTGSGPGVFPAFFLVLSAPATGSTL